MVGVENFFSFRNIDFTTRSFSPRKNCEPFDVISGNPVIGGHRRHAGEAPEFFEPPLSITLKQWDTAFDSQAKAFLVGVREAVPFMRDGGRVLAITYAEGSRTGGLQPWVGMGSAKAALESLVRYFAVTLAKRGITVNAISPGWTEDSVLNTLPEQAQSLIRSWHTRGWTPMGRLGTPEDVGNVAELLCSEKAKWITGQVIYADGGASLMNPEVPPEIQIG